MTPEDVRREAERLLTQFLEGVPAGNPPLSTEVESMTEELRSLLARDRREMAERVSHSTFFNEQGKEFCSEFCIKCWLLSKAEEMEKP